MNNKFTVLTMALMMSTSAAFTAEQLLEVESFTGISLGTGMISNITCGSSNTVTLRGDKKTLDKTEVRIDGDLLDISRKESAGSLFGKLLSNNNDDNGKVEVDVVTAGELSVFDISTGAIISVADCAVNTSQVTVDASTGSEITLNGVTSQLTLDMSTGSMFNRRYESFVVDSVDFDMSTGAIANLCGANTVQGDASTGAIVYLAEGVDDSNVDLSIGAETSSKGCR